MGGWTCAISQGCKFSYFRRISDANFHILSVIPYVSFREGEVQERGGGGVLIGMQVFDFRFVSEPG